MKLNILSDLHVEFGRYRVRQMPESDVIILAGDIGVGASGYAWAEKELKDFNGPVIYVAGNHEYYTHKYSIKTLNEHLFKKTDDGGKIQFLQNSVYEYGDVVFLGTTLWTDFILNGNPHLDMVAASGIMNDYNWISYIVPRGRISAEHFQQENTKAKQFLRDNILMYRSMGKKVVVITHHAPTERSSGSHYRNDPLNVYYCNTIDREIDFPLPNIWVHGHIHDNSDYMLGDCRVICNPRGYSPSDLNPQFDPNLIVEI